MDPCGAVHLVLGCGLYTILSWPMLYGVWPTKGLTRDVCLFFFRTHHVANGVLDPCGAVHLDAILFIASTIYITTVTEQAFVILFFVRTQHVANGVLDLCGAVHLVIGCGLYTILPWPMLYGVWPTKGGSSGGGGVFCAIVVQWY